MPEFRVSRAAEADIRSIGRYTQTTWGKAQRRRYLNGLNAAFRRLAEMPELARERDDFSPPVRIHPYEKHIVIYVVEPGGIVILRVLHQSQNVPARLSER